MGTGSGLWRSLVVMRVSPVSQPSFCSKGSRKIKQLSTDGTSIVLSVTAPLGNSSSDLNGLVVRLSSADWVVADTVREECIRQGLSISSLLICTVSTAAPLSTELCLDIRQRDVHHSFHDSEAEQQSDTCCCVVVTTLAHSLTLCPPLLTYDYSATRPVATCLIFLEIQLALSYSLLAAHVFLRRSSRLPPSLCCRLRQPSTTRSATCATLYKFVSIRRPQPDPTDCVCAMALLCRTLIQAFS